MPVTTNAISGYCESLSKKVKLSEPVPVKNFRHLRKKEPSKSDMNEWLQKSHDSYVNFIARSAHKKKNTLLLMDKIEMHLLKQEVVHIE